MGLCSRLCIVIFAFSTLAAWGGPVWVPPHKVHFVFDIDHLLLDYTTSETGVRRNLPPGTKFIEADGHRYFYESGTEAFVQSKVRVPNSDISFMSSGTPERNEAFLKSLILQGPDGQPHSAWELADQGRRVLSKESVDRVELTDTARVEETSPKPSVFRKASYAWFEKKNLWKLFPDRGDHGWVILFDDTVSNAYRGQEANLFWVRREPKPVLRQGTAPVMTQEINKLARAEGEFVEFMEQWKKAPSGTPPVEVLRSFQWRIDENGEWHYRDELYTDLRYTRVGLRSLKAIDPSVRFVPYPESPEVTCLREMLLRLKAQKAKGAAANR